MPQDPVEFTVQGHRFRRYPLAAIPLVREYDKLRVRVDHDSGVLNTLAFSFDADDFREMLSLDPAGVARLIRLLSMLVDGNKPDAPRSADSSVDGEDTPKTFDPEDVLPRKLDALCLYYARVGKVEYATQMPGTSTLVWHPIQDEATFNAHPFELAPLVVAGHVMGGLFVPFASLLRALFDKAKAALSSSSSNDSAETSEPTVLTSPS